MIWIGWAIVIPVMMFIFLLNPATRNPFAFMLPLWLAAILGPVALALGGKSYRGMYAGLAVVALILSAGCYSLLPQKGDPTLLTTFKTPDELEVYSYFTFFFVGVYLCGALGAFLGCLFFRKLPPLPPRASISPVRVVELNRFEKNARKFFLWAIPILVIVTVIAFHYGMAPPATKFRLEEGKDFPFTSPIEDQSKYEKPPEIKSKPAVTLGWPRPTGNPAHDLLTVKSESEQREVFAKLLWPEFPCRSVGRVFFQGMSKDKHAFWNARCVGGGSYVIGVEPNATGTTRVLDCATMEYVTGNKCFEKFRP